MDRLNQRHNTQQRDATPTNDEYFFRVSAALGAVIKRPVWSPRRSCQFVRTAPSPGAGLWDRGPRELLRQDWMGRVWQPINLPENARVTQSVELR
jgi:hypothetical protein